MVSTPEYAALSAVIYNDQRGGGGLNNNVNTLRIPQGWTDLAALNFTTGDYLNINPFSFTAGAYINASGEIVIAYKGTDFLTAMEGRSWNTVADMLADVGMATTIGNFNVGQQVYAASYFLAVKQWAVEHGYNPANISFTGHSLGGGIAANMAVWFNHPATTFAEGPFRLGTFDPVAILASAVALLVQAGVTASPEILAEILTLGATTTDFSAREAGVNNYYVKGELLQYLRAVLPTVVGANNEHPIDIGDLPFQSDRAIALHSMNLHLALLMDDRLKVACTNIPELIPALLDSTLYNADPNLSQPDFITMLCADQLRGTLTRQDGLLGKFVAEVQKLTGDAGIVAQPEVRTALIAVAMEYIIAKTAANATSIFDATNGLNFKYSDIGAEQYKSLPRLASAIINLLSTAERPYAGRLSAQNAWHIQQGTQALTWSADPADPQNDAAIGGATADSMDGGAGADILIGGAGDDTLTGGSGSDTLLGGLGSDTYLFRPGSGSDTIVDTDGQGLIDINDQQITGGEKVAPDYWISEDRRYGFMLVTNGSGGADLVINEGSSLDKITIRGWQAGQLGITLSDETIPVAAVTPPYVYMGTENHDEVYAYSSMTDSVMAGRGGFDILAGGFGNDRLYADEIVDVATAIDAAGTTQDNASEYESLQGDEGDDLLVGGITNLLYGGGGHDTIIGGGGDDLIQGDSSIGGTGILSREANVVLNFDYNEQKHKNYFYLTQTTDTVSYYGRVGYLADDGAADTIIAGGGRDVVFGELGNDYISLGDGNDVGVGGEDADTVFGGDGNDTIFGDFDWDPSTPNGNESAGELADYAGLDAHFHGNDVLDGGAGNDQIEGNGADDELYGGSGDDRLFGDDEITPGAFHGNDMLDGGSGNDTLTGGGKDDDLYGGAGGDRLFGDDAPAILDGSFHGKDYLDGGAGNDYLEGGGKDDVLFGGDGNDTLWGDSSTAGLSAADNGRDYLDGEAGDDTLCGGGSADQLFGGDGNDMLRGDGDEADVAGAAHGDDYLDGGDGNDVLAGDGGNDTLYGGAGDDELQGDYITLSGRFHGDDLLDGGAGNDRMSGDGGNDTLYGGDGNDQMQGDNANLEASFDGNDVLYGGAGDDSMAGNGGDDFLAGDDGNDQLQGDDGNDTLDGGAGDDLLAGGSGNDQLTGGGGDDQIVGDDGNDTLDGGAGNDVLFADAGDDVLNAGDGDDQAHGGDGNDSMNGGAGDDILFGEAGDDTLDGGGGYDYLDGGAGTNTYILNDQGASTTGVAHTTIADGGGVSIIRFADGTTAAGIALNAVSGNHTDMLLQYGADSVYIQNGLQKSASLTLQFSNGAVMTRAAIMALAPAVAIDGSSAADDILGGSRADTLAGGAGDDLLQGGAGNDQLTGGLGNDTYIFNAGDGQDQIDNSAADNATASDTIALGSGITTADVVFNHIGSDLIVNIGANDRITVRNYYQAGASDSKIDRITFADNTVWDQAAIEQRIVVIGATDGADLLNGFDNDNVIHGLGGNDTIAGNGGNDQLFGDAGADRLDGGAGDDVLDGGSGYDELYGGAGSDTYRFGRGAGRDNVWEFAKAAGDVDTIRMAPDIRPQDIAVQRDYGNSGRPDNLLLYIKLATPGSFNDAITVQNFFSYQDNTAKVQQVSFADGTVWDVATLTALANVVTDSADTVLGYSWGDSLDGRGGDDNIYGLEGNDTLAGGSGNDSLDGGVGDDVLQGGSGNDFLAGGQGNDTLDGGSGDDELDGDAGNDTYVFGRGYGSDTIYEANPSGGSFDTLRLGAGIAPGDLSLTRQGDSLAVSINGSQDQLWVAEFFLDTVGGHAADFRVEQMVFDDGTVWDLNAIRAHVVAAPVNAMTGSAGNDTFVVDNVLDTVTEGVNQGIDTIQSSVSYTLSANVENLTLTGPLDNTGFGNNLDNVIRGNSGNNYLAGGAGTDTLYGGAGNDILDADSGADVLYGGSGNDTYIINNLSTVSTVIELPGEGIDTIKAYGGQMADNVENMLITGYMLYGQNSATGNALDNTIAIVGTNQTGFKLDGGAGADTLVGGMLNDIYVVDNVGDQVVENSAASSADLVQSSVSYTLGANLENLTLTGTAALNGSGNALNNILTGNGGNNVLNGDAGNDRLLGGSGNGNDTLIGGSGNDTYVVNFGDGNDQIDNAASDSATAIDTMEFGSGISGANLTLNRVADDLVVTLGASDEIVVRNHFAAGGAAAIDQFRFADHTLWDQSAIQQHVQTPGAGADALYGTLGNDIVHGLAGNDTIEGFTGDDRLSGDDGADVLFGDSGNDTLDGGTGADQLYGGAGDDTYVVDNAGDSVIESAGNGIDTVLSSVSYTLAGEVENLTLTDSAALFGGGNSLNNIITSNDAGDTLDGAAGDDLLYGGGGDDYLIGGAGADVMNGSAGQDFLMGGAGNDVYLFQRGDGVDMIYEDDSTPGKVDTVRFGASLAPTDIEVSRDLSNLYLSTKGTADQITVSGWGDSDASKIERVEFADGTVWNDTDLLARISVANPTQGDDTIFGRDTSETLQGLGGDDVVHGMGGNDSVSGNAGNDDLGGDAGDDVLEGGAGDDWLDGGTGNDMLTGGDGNDSYYFRIGDGLDQINGTASDNAAATDVIALGDDITVDSLVLNHVGNDLVLKTSASDRITVKDYYLAGVNPVDEIDFVDGSIWDAAAIAQHLVPLATAGADTLVGGAGDDSIHGLDGNDSISGGAGNDQLFGDAGNDTLVGGAGDDLLDGGLGADNMQGGTGNDIYVLENAADSVTENANEGSDTVQSAITLTLFNNVEALILTGTAAINGTGNAGDNLIIGNSANNTENGAAGNDLLQGAAGNDTLTDTAGKNLFDGGAGNDTISGGSGNEFFIGGAGNDTITTSSGADVIAFDRGDGQDLINASTTKDNTLSLGKRIKYADLLLKKNLNDLILVTGTSEQLTFKDWYANVNNHSVAKLQMVIEGTSDYNPAAASQLNNKKITQFNFDGLVGKFDQARAANPALTSWGLSASLLSFFLSASDTAAVGGDLAYQYAQNGNLSAMSMNPALALLADPLFGSANQSLHAAGALQDLSPQLA